MARWRSDKYQISTSLKVGLGIATVYSLYVVLLFAFRGSEPFERNRVSLLVLVTAYYAAGAIGGVIVGLLLPFSKRMGGTLLIAVVIAFVAFSAIGTALEGPFWLWERAVWVRLVGLSLLCGLFGALLKRAGLGL